MLFPDVVSSTKIKKNKDKSLNQLISQKEILDVSGIALL